MGRLILDNRNKSYEGIPQSLFDLAVDLTAPSTKHTNGASITAGTEWLEEIPTSVAGESALIDYPASLGESEGVVINTRVPQHWITAIDHIREMPGTKLPTIWPTRGAFFRWCIAIGMAELNKISKQMNSENPDDQFNIDPALRARIFLEKSGGRVTARASVMNEAQESIKIIATSVKTLMAIDEHSEAADLINEWIAGAIEQDSAFWKNYFSKVLLQEAEMREPMAILIRQGLIVDDYVVKLAQDSGILDADAYFGNDVDTTGDINIGSTGKTS